MVWIIAIVFFVAMVVAALNIWPRPSTHIVFAGIRRLLRLRRREVHVDGLNLVYLEKGKGHPLLLLHGLGVDKSNFLVVGWLLARHYRVIIPDLPGFGESDRPEKISYSIDEQIRRLRLFARSLNLGTFALAGNSMGGFIAGAYAAKHPEDVTSLWLLAPAGVESAEKSDLLKAIDTGDSPPILARSIDEMRQLLNFTTYRAPPIPAFVLRAMAADQAERYEHHVHVMRELLEGPALDARLQSLSPPLATPSLIVWGYGDRALHVSGAGVLQELLPNARVHRMDSVGHAPQIEAPFSISKDYVRFRQSLNG